MNDALDLRDRPEDLLSCTKASFLSIKTQQGQKTLESVTSRHLTRFGFSYLPGITLADLPGRRHSFVGSQLCTYPFQVTGLGMGMLNPARGLWFLWKREGCNTLALSGVPCQDSVFMDSST